MKRRSAVLALALAIPLALGAAVVTSHPSTTAKAGGALAQNSDQSVTARLVYGLLSNSRYAYRAQPLDEADAEAAEKEAVVTSEDDIEVADVEGDDEDDTFLEEEEDDGDIEGIDIDVAPEDEER